MTKRRHTIHHPKKHFKFDFLSKSKIYLTGTVIISMLIIIIVLFLFIKPQQSVIEHDFNEEGLFFAPGGGEGEEPDEEEASCLCTEDTDCIDTNECTTSAVCEECSCVYEEIVCEEDWVCEAGDCIFIPPGSVWKIFMTEERYYSPFEFDGKIGIEAANAICQAEADANDLDGTYITGLSDSTVDLRDRLLHGAYYNMLEELVATSKSDFFDGSISNYIYYIATGELHKNHDGLYVWTGTNSDGTNAPETCNDWTGTPEQTDTGIHGEPDTLNWYLDSGAGFCKGINEHLPLYCIETGTDADGDLYADDWDCDDTNADINPGAEEILDNDIDDNCDGYTDIFTCGGSVPCECGDLLIKSRTLTEEDQLTECSGYGLLIDTNNIQLDCNYQKITSSDETNTADGINIDSKNVFIENCDVSGFGKGTGIMAYTNNHISNSVVTDNAVGISIKSFSNNVILSDILTTNNYNGIDYEFVENVTLMNIDANENSWVGIFLRRQNHNNTFISVTATKNGNSGIGLESSNDPHLFDVTASDNYADGIRITYSDGAILINTIANNNYDGIYLRKSTDNFLLNITANNNLHHGIYLSDSNNNQLSNISAENNFRAGIYLLQASNNILTNITTRWSDNSNTYGGITLNGADDSEIDNFNLIDELKIYNSDRIKISNGFINSSYKSVRSCTLINSNYISITDTTFITQSTAFYNNDLKNSIITKNKLITFNTYVPLYGIVHLRDSTDNHITNNEFTYIYDAFTYEGVSEEDNTIADNIYNILCVDEDDDGYKTTINDVCGSAENIDCNDINPLIHPSAPEYCDGIDYDCDGYIYEEDSADCTVYYYDGDEDTYGLADDSRCLCEPVDTWSATQINDCDDSNADINPAMSEVCDNDIDENCNGQTNDVPVTFYADIDEDSYGDILNTIVDDCFAPEGYVTNALDCDDSDVDEHPDATWYMNADNDTYYTLSNLCERGEGVGWVNTNRLIQGDCNDTNATLYQILEGYQDSDLDTYTFGELQEVCSGDSLLAGYLEAESENIDCNDTNAVIYPNATETCNSIDDNCDGAVDEGDVCVTKTTSSSSSSGGGSSGGGGGGSSMGGSSVIVKANNTVDKETPSTVSTETPTTTQDKVVEESQQEIVEESEELSFFGKIAEFFRNLFD
jgi:parallel beta-helix repeat protein